MVEKYVKEIAQPPEKLKTVGLKRFIEGLYPTCKGNHVADFVTSIASGLEQVVDTNPLNARSPRLNKNFLGVRGSSIKRANLGTPPGYWQVAKLFESTKNTKFDQLTQDVVNQISEGPDMDIIFYPKEITSAKDVFNSAIASLKTKGFCVTTTEENVVNLERIGRRTSRPYDDYHVRVSYKEHGDPQTHPVKAVVVDFNYYEKPVLKVDFIQAPKDEDNLTNFRLSGAASPFDLISFGHIHKTNDGKVLLTYESDLPDFLESPQLFRFLYKHSKSLFLNSFNSRLRTVYQRTMWFNNFNDETQRFFGNYSLPKILKQINLAWANEKQATTEEWISSLKDNNQLPARLAGIIGGFIVGLTYDPFLFLKLAYETKLLTFLPIGQIIKEPADLQKIISLMARKLNTTRPYEHAKITYEELYNQDPTTILPELSKIYQQNILWQGNNTNVESSGAFILLRALNIFLQQQGMSTIEESLTNIVDLFNPLTFYNQFVSKSELTSIPIIPRY